MPENSTKTSSTSQPPTRSTSDVETAAKQLLATILEQFERAAQVAAIEVDTTTAMNTAAATFYAGLQERMEALIKAVDQSRQQTQTMDFEGELSTLLNEAHKLEALVDRLDEYTTKQETALHRVRR